jgi:hypothetical protein
MTLALFSFISQRSEIKQHIIYSINFYQNKNEIIYFSLSYEAVALNYFLVQTFLS